MKKIKFTYFKKEEAEKFAQLCKNVIIEKDKSFRCDTVKVIKSSHPLTLGSYTRMNGHENNIESDFNPDYSYMLERTSKVITENGAIHESTTILLYYGGKDSPLYKNVGVSEDIDIYTDINQLYSKCENSEFIVTMFGDGNERPHTLYKINTIYKILYSKNSNNVSFPEVFDYKINRVINGAVGEEIQNNVTYNIGKKNLKVNDLVVIREDTTIVTPSLSGTKSKYIIYDNR